MISRKELFAEISNEAVCEDGEVVGYFVKNNRMDTLEQMLCGTVTVKLPELCVGVVQGGHAVMVPYAAGHWFNKTAILEMLTAAGIKWEGE